MRDTKSIQHLVLFSFFLRSAREFVLPVTRSTCVFGQCTHAQITCKTTVVQEVRSNEAIFANLRADGPYCVFLYSIKDFSARVVV